MSAWQQSPKSRAKQIRLYVEHSPMSGLELAIFEGLSELARLPLRRGPFSSSELMCEEILRGYGAGDVEELDGKPTREQLRHWQGHLISPRRDGCGICAKGLAQRWALPKPKALVSQGPRNVERTIVRRVGGDGGRPPLRVHVKSADELGL